MPTAFENQHPFWPNYRFDLPCVQKLMDDNNGFNALVCADPSDSTRYFDFQDKSFLPNLNVNDDVKIKGLLSNKFYQITWWRTNGNGGPDATFNIRKKTNIAGNLILEYPDDLGADATDWGIKIIYDDDKSLDQEMDSTSNDYKVPPNSVEIKTPTHLVVFPNPTQNELYIKTSELLENISNIQIFNSLGQLVYSENSNKSTFVVETYGWPRGIYLICVKTMDNNIYYSKLVKI